MSDPRLLTCRSIEFIVITIGVPHPVPYHVVATKTNTNYKEEGYKSIHWPELLTMYLVATSSYREYFRRERRLSFPGLLFLLFLTATKNDRCRDGCPACHPTFPCACIALGCHQSSSTHHFLSPLPL